MANPAEAGMTNEPEVNRELVTSKDYVTASPDSTRCVDERGDKEGENLGVQMPGASEHIMDLMLVAVLQDGGKVPDEQLMEMTEKVYASSVAKENSLVLGMHIDDEHGHLDMDACGDRNHGCGYDKVRGTVIKNVFDYEVESNPGTRIEKAREKGWGIQVLTKDHIPYASAAINKMVGKTLKTKSLLDDGRNPSFNHDIWVVEKLLPEMISQLEEAGFDGAAEILNENSMDWSEKLYGETLNVLSNGALTGESLIVIE